MASPRFRGDQEAVSANVAVVLMVGIVVVVGVAVVFFTNEFTDQQDAPEQKATFQAFPDPDGPGGRLQVVSVPGGPLDWSEVRLGGSAACVLPAGPIEAGDEVVCSSPGTVTLVHDPDESVLYFGEFR
ncbi:MAG: hypothetical protein QOD77_37 [Thermoplasmata archaeon]|nr:hypothetical protein [Thermoplasmata archaeon]